MFTLVSAILALGMGLPVVFVLGLVGMVYLFSRDMPFILIAQRLFVGLDAFVLLAIPFYVLMGNIMSRGKVTDILSDGFGEASALLPSLSASFFPGSRVRVRRMLRPSEVS
jgi:TRAP-type mannitol/chloroaromatic compound transport system permease large subunit